MALKRFLVSLVSHESATMAKASDDKNTLELPGLPAVKRRGRAPSGHAKTPAERMATLRAKRKAKAEQATVALDDVLASLEHIRTTMVQFGSPALVETETMKQAWEDWYQRLITAKEALQGIKNRAG